MSLLISLLILTVPAESTRQSPPPSLEEVLSAREFQKFNSEDKYHDRIEILRRSMEELSRRIGPLTRKADLSQAYHELAQIRTLCDAATTLSDDESDSGELRHKEVKRLEIVVRKMLTELEDLKTIVSFQERDPYERTSEMLADLRDRLLEQLFAGSLGESVGGPGLGWAPRSPGTPTPGQDALASIDRFTDDEFERIRITRKLEDRTEAFLAICEARLLEIERRRNNEAWEKEEVNPLELHSFGDMLHAYKRSMDSLMITIDERAREKTAEEKEIRKSLEMLNEKSLAFQPRLEVLEELVREYKDPELARQLRLAIRSNNQAIRGSQFGLGAPQN